MLVNYEKTTTNLHAMNKERHRYEDMYKNVQNHNFQLEREIMDLQKVRDTLN